MLVPITLACSYAFMLPIATPTNAIVYSSKVLEIKDLVKYVKCYFKFYSIYLNLFLKGYNRNHFKISLYWYFDDFTVLG